MTTETSRSLAAEDIAIEAREPRHRLDTPVLIAWTTATEIGIETGTEIGAESEIEWAIDVTADGVAHVVCKDVYDGTAPTGVQTEVIPATEPIPRALARALSEYRGQFGPIETIVNPIGAAVDD